MPSRRSAFVALLTVVPILAAPAANAGSVEIEFDLTNSTLTMLNGILTLPPDGTITAATARVTVPAASLSAPLSGVAQVSSLVLSGTLNGTVGGAVLLTGGFSGNQVGGGAGVLSGGLANLALGSLSLDLNGIVNCFGGQCPALGTFPISATNWLTVLTGLDSFGVGGLATPGAGTLTGVLPMNLAGNSVVVSLIGQEVSRIFVPEPGTGSLLGLAVLGLLGARAARGRAR